MSDLWLSLLLLPLLGIVARCMCCETATCESCLDGVLPAQFQIDIAGFSFPACCANYNATYYIDIPVPGTACTFSWGNATLLCNPGFGDYGLTIDFLISGGTYYVCVRLLSPLQYILFEKDLGATAPDCTTFSALNIPVKTSGSGNCGPQLGYFDNASCAYTGTTCALTSL